MSRQRHGDNETPAVTPREVLGTVEQHTLYTRTQQGACGCLGQRMGWSADYKDLSIDHTSDMHTPGREGKQLTLMSS